MIPREKIDAFIRENDIDDSEWMKEFMPKAIELLEKGPYEASPFRISRIHFSRFSAPEYCGLQEQVKGNNCLIWGEHRTGKSTTFDAFLFSLMGAKGPLRSEMGNPILSLELTNGKNNITIVREHQKGLVVKADERTFRGEEANSVLEDLTGISPADFLTVRAMFLPQRSETDSILLRVPKPKDLMRIIQTIASDRTSSSMIRFLGRESESTQTILDGLANEVADSRNDIATTKDRIGFTKYHLKELRDFSNRYETGEIEKIVETLRRDPEMREEISKLEQEFDKLWPERNHLKKTIGTTSLKYSDKTPEEVVENILSKVVCPVCEHGIDGGRLKGRLDGKTKCPLCNESYSWKILKAAETKIEAAKNIEEWRKRLSEIESRLKEIEKRKRELKIEYSHETVRRVMRNEYSKPHYENVVKKIEEGESLLDEDNNTLRKIETNLVKLLEGESDIKKRLSLLTFLKDNLKTPTESSEILDYFLKNLNEFYKSITDNDTILELKDDQINLVEKYNGYISSRSIRDRYAVSVGERRAVDVSLLLSFLLLNRKFGYLNIDFVVLDDPTEGILSPTWKANLLSLLENMMKESQVICTSFDPPVREATFDQVFVLKKQTKLPEFTEPSPS